MSVSLTIGGVVTPPRIFKSYELVIRTMAGDADGYSKVSLLYSPHELYELKATIDLLERMKAEYPYGKGGYDNYDHLEGFEELLMEEYPFNSFMDCEETLQSYEVYYHDEQGVKFSVGVSINSEKREVK